MITPASSLRCIEAIWIKRAHRGAMDPVPRAELRAGRGLVGNADQGGRRQVTLIETEIWRHLRERLGPGLAPTARRANLLVSGVALAHSTGRILWLGPCRLRIGGETRPCDRMDEEFPGLQEALRPDWRAGVFAEVLDDGVIAVGDEARWDDGPVGA